MAYYGKNGGEILRRELLPQFFTNSHEIWHRCLPWGVDVQDTFFWQWQKVCCYGNGIWQKWGENLASRTTSSVFHHFSWNLAQMFDLGCRCARHIFWQWQKVCCHGNGILWQKWGENLASRTTSSVFHQFSWNLAQMFALGCRCARHIFWQWQKVSCHGNSILWQKIGEKSCIMNYFLSFWTILMELSPDVCLGV